MRRSLALLLNIYRLNAMGILEKGITGPITGKIGSIITYDLNGQNVARSVGKRTKPPTVLERLNRARMKAVSEFLTPIKPYVKFGFQREAPRGSRVGAFQLAQSHLRKNAIAYDAENNPYIDPAKALIAKGTLVPPFNARLEVAGNRITLLWDVQQGGRSDDRLFIVLYDGDKYRDFRELGAKREEMKDVWEADFTRYTSRPIHVYGAFRDTLFDVVSDSVYFGAFAPNE